MPSELDILLIVIIVITATALIFVLRTSRLNARLSSARQAASTDSLTELLNRSAFTHELAVAFDADGPLQLVYIDLANFKEINDTLGHEAGDTVLQFISRRLISHTPTNGRVARVGGDEFCIILPETSLDRAQNICAKLASSENAQVDLGGRLVSAAMSIGIAERTEDCSNADELLRRADRAMYEAKQGQSGPMVYDASMDEAQRVKREIRNELGLALAQNELKLFYQPLVDARTGELVSAEALMRWPNKVGPAGSPAEFIPIAEETGLIQELGTWALQTVLSEIKLHKNLPIALNVSPRQFLTSDFARTVADALIKEGVEPRQLKIEITEGVLIQHTTSAQRILRELREIGVQILLDDFGTGYSSLSYIQKFKFDALKIDRAFVRAMDGSETGQDLLRSIVNMGHSLNMKVIAEGVETKRQAAALQLLGCDILQGYALGAPGPAERLRSYTLPAAVAPVLAKAG